MEDFIKQQNSVSWVVDMETAKVKGKGYEHWAKKHNLKNASRACCIRKWVLSLPKNWQLPVMPHTRS